MNNEKSKFNILKMLLAFIAIVLIVIFVKRGINVLQNISQICVVENGSLKFEEDAYGYILRDEVVLQGENCKNGMVQIISEGQRVAKNKPTFRYYSNGEEEIIKQIATLDDEINADIETSGLTIFSTDITNLEVQIEQIVDSMYKINDLEELQDKKSELDTYISKKTKITGNLSPSDSHIKSLIEKRNALETQLSSASEVINSPISGTVSYRVDGLEEILSVTDFSYLNTEFLESLNTKANVIVATSTEKGKVVNNFECYIACPMNSEKASVAKVGDKVTLSIPVCEELSSEIVYISEEDNDKRVIVFKVSENVEELIQYREVSLDVIWWNYQGLKISNSAILEENDIPYVEKTKAGYTEKIYVKILRQNDTYSIVENYTDEELVELGLDMEKINDRAKLNIYDEILLH